MMPNPLRLLVVLLAAFLWSGVGVGAATAEPSAGEPVRRALQLAEQAAAHAEAGRLDEAIEAFEEAQRVAPDPAFLFNLGVLYAEQDALHLAILRWEAFLAAFPQAPNRVEVEQDLERLRSLRAQHYGRVQLRSAPAGAHVWWVGPRSEVWLGETPLEVWAPPGEVRLRVAKEGRRSELRTFQVSREAPVAAEVLLMPATQVALERGPQREGLHVGRLLGWSMVALGGVSLAAGTYALVTRDEGPTSASRERRTNHARFLGLGGVGLAIGGGVVLWQARASRSSSEATLSWELAPGYTGAVWRVGAPPARPFP